MRDHYSPKSFLRKTSATMLAAYFQHHNIAFDFDFSALNKGHRKINELHDVINGLPDDVRHKMQGDFQDIAWLSHESGGGWQSILREADYQKADLSLMGSELETLQDKVMWVFLNQQSIFKACLRLAKRHIYTQAHWRQIDIPDASFACAPDRINALSQKLVNFFKPRYGKGTACQIEVYDRGNLHYFFACLDDYSRKEQEYDNKHQFRPVLRCPTFEVIMVFDTDTNRLDIFVEADKSTAQGLQRGFASVMLNIELPERKKDKRIYNLNPLRNRGFQFVVPQNACIKAVRINRLRLTSPDYASRIIVDNSGEPLEGMYNAMDIAVNKQGTYGWNVTQANLSVFFEEPEGQQSSMITFNITSPSSCTLGQEGRFGIIRQMLKDSGIDITNYENQRISA